MAGRQDGQVENRHLDQVPGYVPSSDVQPPGQVRQGEALVNGADVSHTIARVHNHTGQQTWKWDDGTLKHRRAAPARQASPPAPPAPQPLLTTWQVSMFPNTAHLAICTKLSAFCARQMSQNHDNSTGHLNHRVHPYQTDASAVMPSELNQTCHVCELRWTCQGLSNTTVLTKSPFGYVIFILFQIDFVRGELHLLLS